MIAATNSPITTAPREDVSQWENEGGAPPVPRTAFRHPNFVNVCTAERVVSAIAGGILVLNGVTSRSFGSICKLALGGGLLYRGLSGHCATYSALNMSTATPDEKAVSFAPEASIEQCCSLLNADHCDSQKSSSAEEVRQETSPRIQTVPKASVPAPKRDGLASRMSGTPRGRT